MQDRRAIIVLVIVLVVIVGGGIGFKIHSANNAKIVAAPDPTTTSSTSTTLPAAAGLVDWNAELTRIVNAENGLYEKPDPTAVGGIMTPTCTCYSQTVTNLNSLLSKGWHSNGPSETIKTAAFQSGTATSVTLVVTPKLTGNATVDATGKVVQPAPTGTVQPLIYVLSKGDDGVWRISDRHLLPELNQ